MKILKRIAVVLGALLAGFVVAVGVGTLASLDWDREHSARTAALPVFGPDASDGLVRIPVNGMEFRARVAGFSNSGPDVILLHGFPVTSAMWEPLIPVLAENGFRVVAIDQRGYSPGARPDGVENYLLPELIDDVVSVADAVGFERFNLIGHDWGCVVGWGVAIQHGDRLLSWTGLSLPHPGALLEDLSQEPPTYIRIFTAPLVPEAILGFNGLANLHAAWEGSSPEQIADFEAAFAEPGALTATLNWYRGITEGFDRASEVDGPVSVSTRFIYGDEELWVTAEALERQRGLVTGSYEELELEAGHFVLRERPEAVISAVLAHLTGGGP